MGAPKNPLEVGAVKINPAAAGASSSTNKKVVGKTYLPATKDAADSSSYWSEKDDVDVLVVSTLGVDSAQSTVIYLPNNDYLQFITNNGNGAGTIAYTFDDATTDGHINSDKIRIPISGMGKDLMGFQLRILYSNDNAQSGIAAQAFQLLKPTFYETDDNGAQRPLQELSSTSGQYRSDQDKTIMNYTMGAKPQNISKFINLGLVMPGLNLGASGQYFSFALTWHFHPNF